MFPLSLFSTVGALRKGAFTRKPRRFRLGSARYSTDMAKHALLTSVRRNLCDSAGSYRDTELGRRVLGEQTLGLQTDGTEDSPTMRYRMMAVSVLLGPSPAIARA